MKTKLFQHFFCLEADGVKAANNVKFIDFFTVSFLIGWMLALVCLIIRCVKTQFNRPKPTPKQPIGKNTRIQLKPLRANWHQPKPKIAYKQQTQPHYKINQNNLQKNQNQKLNHYDNNYKDRTMLTNKQIKSYSFNEATISGRNKEEKYLLGLLRGDDHDGVEKNNRGSNSNIKLFVNREGQSIKSKEKLNRRQNPNPYHPLNPQQYPPKLNQTYNQQQQQLYLSPSLKKMPNLFRQQHLNFLYNIKKSQQSESLIYKDELYYQEKQFQRKQIQKKRLLKQQINKNVNIKQKEIKEKELKQLKERELKEKELLKQAANKLTGDQNTLLSQKLQQKKDESNFKEAQKQQRQQPQPQKVQTKSGLNFGQVTLGIPSQKTIPKDNKQQQPKKSLFENIGKPQQQQNKPTGGLLPAQVNIGQGQLPNNTSLFGGATVQQKQQQPKPGSLFENIDQNTSQKLTTQEQKKQTHLQPQQSQPKPIASIPQKSAPKIQKIQKPDYLQKLINYSKSSKQQCELKKTKINNFGRSISNLKQIYDTSIDFINTINNNDPKELETLACNIFDFLFNITIPNWPKQQGWEMFPPRGKNQTQWKISINTYVLKLNLYRAMGHQTLWLIVFGKLLSLLDFTWKRTQKISKSESAVKQLDLVKNGYFSLQKQDDMAPKYFTRLDLITYFLFCMTTFDPELVGQYLCQTAGQDKNTYEEIKKLKYKWSYNYFWILVETILKNKNKTYFKPLLYMNIISSIYLQIRKNKINQHDFKDFEHLRKYMVKEAIEETAENELERNEEIQTLSQVDEHNKNYTFDGDDFLAQIQTLNFYFKEKDGEYRKASVDRKGFEEFEKRCSVFDYFKPQSKLG